MEYSYLCLLMAALIVPPAVYGIGRILERPPLELGFVIYIAMSLALGSLIASAAFWLANGWTSPLQLVAIILAGTITIFPVIAGILRTLRHAPVVHQNNQNEKQEHNTDARRELRGQTPSECDMKYHRRLGNDPLFDHQPFSGYIYHRTSPLWLPGNYYAYRHDVEFLIHESSVEVNAKITGWLLPWYQFGLGSWDGPYVAESYGEGVAECKHEEVGCKALAYATPADLAISGVFSSAVVINASADSDRATFEASAAVTYDGEVAVESIGIAGKGVSSTIKMPTKAGFTKHYGYTVIFKCK